MSAPVQPTQSASKGGGASRIVGVVALVAAVLAVVLIVLGVVGLARTATPNMQGFNAGAIITVSDSGASIYARSDAERTRTVCTVGDGGDITTLERPTSEFSVDVSGSDFYEVARTPASLVPGSYPVRCEGTTAALYIGPSAPSTSASGLLGPVSLVGGVALALLALGLGVVAVVLRWMRRKPADGPSGYPYASGVAQPGDTSPYASPPDPAASPYAAPSARDPYGTQSSGHQPYGQQGQAPYGQPPSGQPTFEPPTAGRGSPSSSAYTQPIHQGTPPPPPPSWTTAPSEPTQAIAYGQGRYAPPPQPKDDDVVAEGTGDSDQSAHLPDDAPPEGPMRDAPERDEQSPDQRPSGTSYPPPPPPQ
ncbi:MAG: hypothetical protein WA966_09750 [Ornithinimicrobium sp.]